jgi:hypothetical protein
MPLLALEVLSSYDITLDTTPEIPAIINDVFVFLINKLLLPVYHIFIFLVSHVLLPYPYFPGFITSCSTTSSFSWSITS